MTGVRSPVVVKIGGSTLGSQDTTLADIAAVWEAGPEMVVVHGGGAAVSAALESSGIPVQFQNGLRVTDAATLDVLVSVAAGRINTSIVSQLAVFGVRPVGLTGVDGPTLFCHQQDPALGLVGTIDYVSVFLLDDLMEMAFLPVVAPLGVLAEPKEGIDLSRLREQADEREVSIDELFDVFPQPLNLNADTAAGHLAVALRAQQFVLLTDTEGVRGESGETLTELDGAAYDRLRAGGTIAGGMVPKVEAALLAARAGIPAVIADGRRPGALQAAMEGSAGTRIRV